MTNNVLDISTLRGRKNSSSGSGTVAPVFDLDRTNRARAKVVREKIESRPRVENAGQRILLAQNLWKILADLEGAGHRKAFIAQAAGLGDELSSTKRLYNYALDPSAGEDRRPDAAKRLTKTVRKYVHVVETAAGIVGRSPDALLLALVSGTQYDAVLGNEGLEVPANDYSYELAEFLTQLGRKMAKKYNLDGYFRYLANRNIAYDSDTSAFGESYSPFETAPRAFAVGDWEEGGYATDFLPAIPLFYRYMKPDDEDVFGCFSRSAVASSA